MIVNILGENRNYIAAKYTPKALFDEIMVDIDQTNLVLSHMIIDGEEVKNGHEKYIQEHYKEIEEIVVVTMEKLDLALENAALVKESLEQFVPILDVMAQDFRLGVSARGWKEFENMINTLLYLDKGTKAIFNMFLDADIPNMTSAWDLVREEYMKLYKPIKSIEEALNADDPAKGGDIIQNDIKPILQRVIELIEDLQKK